MREPLLPEFNQKVIFFDKHGKEINVWQRADGEIVISTDANLLIQPRATNLAYVSSEPQERKQ